MDNQIFTNKAPNFQKTFKEGKPILKIIFIIFALVIAFEILIGLKTILTPIKVVKKIATIPITEASIKLSTKESLFKVGDTIPVLVKVSTGNHLTAGVDLVIKYDPTLLEASSSSLIKGNTYDDYPAVDIDSKKGFLRASGVVSPSKQGFNGSGDLGTINFIAKTQGETTISLEFLPNLTEDSNMIESITNKDILEKVESVKINIQ